MSKNQEKNRPAEKRAARLEPEQEIVAAILEEAIRRGEINPKGKSDEELRAEFLAYVKRATGPAEFEIIIDHTGTLLAEARAYRRASRFELACVLYATWVEHFLNQLIQLGAIRRGLVEADAAEMIRGLSYRGKATWALPLLGFRRIAPGHVAALLKLGELRNRYIHYKWRGRPADAGDNTEFADSVGTFEKTVAYLRRYQRREVFADRATAAKDYVRRHSQGAT